MQLKFLANLTGGSLENGLVTWLREGELLIVTCNGYVYNAVKGTWLRSIVLPYHVEAAYASAITGTSALAWLALGEYNNNGTLMIRCDTATSVAVYGQIIGKITS